MTQLIIKKHLEGGEEVRGYGWIHFMRNYNLVTHNNNYKFPIGPNSTDWESHVKQYEKFKNKPKKKIPNMSWKVKEIEKWIKDNNIRSPGKMKKKDLIEYIKLNFSEE